MEILEFLQGIRNPIWTGFNLVITNLGTEIILIAILCALYWCINKKYAYRIGFAYFISGLAIQTIKIICKVPRPWILSKKIKPVKEAVAGATGYSFPSGHTQSATSLYGTIAYNSKKRVVHVIMLILILAVGFSRMYLGVHSPMDVAVSMIVTFIITFGCNYVIEKKIVYKFRLETIAAVLFMIPMLMLVFGIFKIVTGGVDTKNAMDYFKATGAALGFVAAWYLESTTLNFDETKGSTALKVIRYIIGIALMLGLKVGLKKVLGAGITAGVIRYALIVFVGMYVYPLMFTKLGEKCEKA